MYNEKYVETFREEQYLNFLRNGNQLDDIANNYLNRYTDKQVDAMKLAFKDSLDNYVAKKISENKNYINTPEFKNYTNYLRKITTSKKYINEQGLPMYIEFSTNKVFEYLDENMLNQIFPGNRIKYEIAKNEDKIGKILEKINNNQSIQKVELEIISDYFDNKKDLENENYTKYMEYIFAHSKDIHPTPKVISAILTYLPGFYREGVQNSRAYLATIDGRNKINIAHSSGGFPYVCFDANYFKNLDFNSYESAKSSRMFDKNDIMFLLFVGFHELTHQKQKIEFSNNKFDSMATEINRLLRQYTDEHYYNRNHDSDEIEIEADEKGWLKCAGFSKFITNQNDLFNQCRKNARDIHSRRAFSVKTDEHGNKKRYIDYDVENTINVIKNNKGVLKNYPNLSKIFDENGRIKVDFLFQEKITNTNVGREFSNYILNKVPIELLSEKINSGNYSAKQVEILINNFVEVPHYNALTLRELKKANFNTYNQTATQYDISKQFENVTNYYFAECCHQMKKFDKLLEIVSNQNVFDKNYIDVNSYRAFFEDYYFEMLDNINNPNIPAINNILADFETSNSEQLKILAMRTREKLQEKTPKISIDNIKDAITQSKITTTDMQKVKEAMKYDINMRQLKDKGDMLTSKDKANEQNDR